MDTIDVQIAALTAAGLTDDEVMRLCSLRERIQTGECHEETTEYRRRLFQRYLAIKAGRYLAD